MHVHGALAQAASLPMHTGLQRAGSRGLGYPPGPPSPPTSVAAFEDLVSKLSVNDLLALKDAVERQLTKQALALAAAGLSPPPLPSTQASADVLYAAAIQQALAQVQAQNAQAAVVQQQVAVAAQLSQQQQSAAQATAIQHALAAAAAASGVSLPPRSVGPEGGLARAASHGHGSTAAAALGPFGSVGAGGLPLGAAPPPVPPAVPDPTALHSPFANPPFAVGPTPDSLSPAPMRRGLGSSSTLVAHGSVGMPLNSGGPAARSAGGSGESSPRTTSAEAHLIGDALHSILDPSGVGRPSRHNSSALGWADRQGSGASAALAGVPAGLLAQRSKSLPQADVLFRSASLKSYLGECLRGGGWWLVAGVGDGLVFGGWLWWLAFVVGWLVG